MTPKISPDEFESKLISEYLKHGSIEQVFKVHHFDLPVSFATYHRILNKFQVVKSAGPNSKLSESLHILSLINNYKLPLEKIYHKHAPNSLKVSTNTLHRILHNVRLGVTRRCGAALLISKESEPNKYLVGKDISLGNNLLGNSGDISLPMSHTRMQDSHYTSVLRVLEQEVFANQTISATFPHHLIDKGISPAFFINIADIKVGVFRLVLPDTDFDFSSFRLINHQFLNKDDLFSQSLRPGVGDIIEYFESNTYKYLTKDTPVINSQLNLSLAYAKSN